MSRTAGSPSEEGIRDITLFMWKQRFSPLQIAEATGEPVGVVYGRLKRLGKALVKEKGVQDHGKKIHT